jgi:hypothetical protein
MAATPIIVKTGSISGPSTPGQGADDLVAGEVVTLSDAEAANAGASYEWSFLDIPVGSVASLVNPTSPTPFFTVGSSGSYWVQCKVDGVDTASEIFARPLANTGARIPAFQEQTTYDEAGNVKGWHPALTDFMRTTDVLLPSSSEKEAFFGAVGNRIIRPIWIGGRESYGDVGSDTPLVVGAIAFNPALHVLQGTLFALAFRAIAAVGDSGVTAHVQLFNVTDNESVSILNVTATTVGKLENTLFVGSGAGQIENSEKIYEVRVYVDTPSGPADSIELYSVELIVTNTIT